MDKDIKRQKGVEGHPIGVCVDKGGGGGGCGKTPIEKGAIRTGKKVYMPPLTSTYKETENQRTLIMSWNGCSETTGYS